MHFGRDGDKGGRSGGAEVVVGVEIGDCWGVCCWVWGACGDGFANDLVEVKPEIKPVFWVPEIKIIFYQLD